MWPVVEYSQIFHAATHQLIGGTSERSDFNQIDKRITFTSAHILFVTALPSIQDGSHY
jgi:hypothetical protein